MRTSPDRSATTGASMEGMSSVLFPIRIFHDPHVEDGRNQLIPATDSLEASSSVGWQGMTPLEMIEKLAIMTEIKEFELSGHPADPLRIGDTKLSTKSSTMRFPKGLVTPPSPNSPFSNFSAGEEEHTPDSPKRKHSALSSNHDSYHSWNLHQFVARDPYAGPTIDRIASLCTVLESAPKFENVFPSYRRTQEHFVDTFEWIMQQYHRDPTCDGREHRNMLTVLYNETIQKMEALVEMAQQTESNDTKPPASTATLSTSSSVSPLSESPATNQSVSTYMTNWLRENWIYPFPRKLDVAVMAMKCGTLPKVITNWLVNARTRKWRNAIEKAILLNRTSDHLWDDSIDIFDGKIIPGFENHEVFKKRKASKRARTSHNY